MQDKNIWIKNDMIQKYVQVKDKNENEIGSLRGQSRSGANDGDNRIFFRPEDDIFIIEAPENNAAEPRGIHLRTMYNYEMKKEIIGPPSRKVKWWIKFDFDKIQKHFPVDGDPPDVTISDGGQ